jgi:LPXTG-motif cell wall-anchored protein
MGTMTAAVLMDNEMMIRVVAGVLFVVVLFIIIWRRKRKASE